METLYHLLSGILGLIATPPQWPTLDLLGMPYWASQFPLLLYFLVSLNELPFDLAFLRVCTCYFIPLLLWISFRTFPLFGVAILVAMYYFLTKSVPFSPIRVPFGRLRTVVRSRVAQRISNFRKRRQIEDVDLAVNPVAAGVYVDIIYPFFFVMELVESKIRTPRKPSPAHASRINYLFTFINFVDRNIYRLTGWNIFFPPRYKKLVEHAKKSEAIDLIGEPEPVGKACELFFKNIETKNPMQVSATGRLLLLNFIWGNFDTRIVINKFLRSRPDILKIPIKAPVIIVGLPRTGSTVLQRLLALDPDSRALKFWEMNLPIPPPKEATYHNDIRIHQVQRGLDAFKLIDPTYVAEVSKFHELKSNVYEEELVIAMNVGIWFSQYYLTGENSEFEQWLFDSSDKRPLYTFMKQFLQILSSDYFPRSHWILKAPFHSLYIDVLCSMFPDARFVNTHRDPRETIVSWTKFQYQMLSPYTEVDAVPNNLAPYARQTHKLISTMARRVHDFRSPGDRYNILDITLKELTTHPIETVEKIYKHYSMPISNQFRLNMENYIAKNRVDASARPKSPKSVGEQLTDLGLNAKEIEREFEYYHKEYLQK